MLSRLRSAASGVRFAWLLFGLAWLGLVTRAPNLLQWPRFHAEEGKYYFSYAFDHGWLDTLTYVYFRAAYLNLWTNLAVTAAARVPLESAPLVTTSFALAVQTVPLLLICFSRSELFADPLRRVLGCALVVFAPHVPAEVWLTTLQSQVWLGFVGLLVLLEPLDGAGRVRRWCYRALLAVGALSGPYTLFLQPAFALRALIDRSRERWVHVTALTLGGLGQVAIYLGTDRVNPLREGGDALELVENASLRHVAWPLFGPEATDWLTGRLGGFGEYAFLIGFFVLLAVGLVDWRRRRLCPAGSTTYLAAAFALLAGGTGAFSMGTAGGRYAVVSGFAVLLYVLCHLRRPYHRPVSVLALASLGFALLVGLRTELFREWTRCDGASPTPWKEQVASWRQEPAQARFWKREVDDTVVICPASPSPDRGGPRGWRMELKRH